MPFGTGLPGGFEAGTESFLAKKKKYFPGWSGLEMLWGSAQARSDRSAQLCSAPWPRPECPWVRWACWRPSTWSLARAGCWGGRCHFFNSLVSAPKNGAVELIKTVHVPGISTLLNTLLNQSQCTLGLGFGEVFFCLYLLKSLLCSCFSKISLLWEAGM